MPRLAVLALLVVAAPAHADPHLTFEANLGTGGVPQIYTHGGSLAADHVGAGSVALGGGAFVLPELAISVRYAHANYVQGEAGDNGSASFVGISAQGWLAPRLWLGAGLGIMYDDPDTEDLRFRRGIAPALDLRAGVAVVRTWRLAVNLSLEYTPGFYLSNDISILGIFALAAGVQLQ